MAREGKSLAPQFELGRGTQRGRVESTTAQSSHVGWALPLESPSVFRASEKLLMGTPAPLRRLLSVLILLGMGVVVLEATDGAADGK